MPNISPINYYVYVSTSKVEMLYSQIPKPLLTKITSNIKINFQFADISFADKQLDDTIYSKLNIVQEYLLSEGYVGSISKPKEYFHGSMFLEWAQIHQGVVYFGGKYNDIALGLGGSMKHVLGYLSRNVEQSFSHIPWLASYIISELQLRVIKPDIPNYSSEETERRILDSATWLSDDLTKIAINKFEFIAKTLKNTQVNDQKILIGTPLYIALDK